MSFLLRSYFCAKSHQWAQLWPSGCAAPGAPAFISFLEVQVGHMDQSAIQRAGSLVRRALLVTRFVLNVNVLDLGAGTGRSSIMVLQSRPQATLVALDLFAESFEQHFGHSDSPEQKLLANLKAAGVDARATVQKADMRKLPFEPATFDAVVSAYAIDHLNRKGIGESLSEAARVVKPGGDFLLILIGRDPWGQFAFGPLLMHMGGRGPDWWAARLEEAHFKVVEHGVQPITRYFLARRQISSNNQGLALPHPDQPKY